MQEEHATLTRIDKELKELERGEKPGGVGRSGRHTISRLMVSAG